MVFEIRDGGTARTLAWTTGVSKGYRAVGVSLPTTSANLSGAAGKVLYVGMMYNITDDRWDVVAVSQEQ